MKPLVVLESHDPLRNPRSFRFADPIREIAAHKPDEVRGVIECVVREVAAGRHAAGILCYEAASGFDPAMRVKLLTDLPLVWFGIFRDRVEITPGQFGSDAAFSLSDWASSLERETYANAIARIREYIASGDTYQVNFTFRQRATFSGSPIGFFRALCRSQRAGFCAYMDLGRHAIISASPEMFLRLEGRELTVRPMKGTMRRGRWWDEDESLARALEHCPKNRAENVMIVDLMRNDLGRVAEVGSVVVPRLYEVERYDTVFQMTSTVQCRVRENVALADLFAAVFPSGSVTGAPKMRTMQIIKELEDSPRGVYTGAIGFVSPRSGGPPGEMDSMFSVAIRTVVLDNETKRAEFGVGSGITFDSVAEAEYAECKLKTRFLTTSRPDFELLETLLCELPSGYFLLSRHLERLEKSARYFGFRFDRQSVAEGLQTTARQWNAGRFRVRLLLTRNGSVAITHGPAPPLSDGLPKVAIASAPIDSGNPFLYHKTTRREVYESRARTRSDCADVLLINERGEVTESAIANLVVAMDGRLYTPPIHSGLLPGVFRAELLEGGRIVERVIRPEDLEKAEAVYLVNSLRKWVRVKVVP